MILERLHQFKVGNETPRPIHGERGSDWDQDGLKELLWVIEQLKGIPIEAFLAGYEMRHNAEKHVGSFQACREEWCAHARNALIFGDEFDLSQSYETRHREEGHLVNFDQCDDRWCQYYRELMNAILAFDY